MKPWALYISPKSATTPVSLSRRYKEEEIVCEVISVSQTKCFSITPTGTLGVNSIEDGSVEFIRLFLVTGCNSLALFGQVFPRPGKKRRKKKKRKKEEEKKKSTCGERLSVSRTPGSSVLMRDVLHVILSIYQSETKRLRPYL